MIPSLLLYCVKSHHLNSVLIKLKETGCTINSTEDTITISPTDSIQATDITTAVYPGFPTDLQAQIMVLMTKGEGISTIKE